MFLAALFTFYQPKIGNNPNIHQQINKQLVVCPYSGVLFSNKKEQTDTLSITGEFQKHDAERKKPDTKENLLYEFHL